MASADEYAAWIVDNQSLKGTPNFDTVATAYEEAKATEVSTAQPAFGGTPGGAAVYNPPARSGIISDLGTAVPAIAGSTGLSAAGGLAAPRILQAVGRVVGAVPLGRGPVALGQGIQYLSTAAGAATPTARAASGAFSGFGAEVAGQTAETLGAGPVTAEGARLVGGALTPEFIRASGTMVVNVLSHWALPGRFDAIAIRDLARQLRDRLKGTLGREVTEDEQAYITQLIADFRGSQKPGEALDVIGRQMETGAVDVADAGTRQAAQTRAFAQYTAQNDQRQVAKIAEEQLKRQQAAATELHTTARTVLNEAENAARAELTAVTKGAVPAADAETYITALKQNTIKTAREAQSAIGTNRDASLLGSELKDAAIAREQKFRKAASDAFTASQESVTKRIAELEGAGVTISKNPAYQTIIADLKAQLTPGRNSPDVAAGYKKLLTELTGGGADVPVSYNSVDQTRRLLGESFGAPRVEGYGNIDLRARQDLYRKLRDLQVNYGGKQVDDLLTNYADSRPALAIFGSKAGQQLTAMDRKALTEFATDPAKIPAYFFKTSTSFRQLVDLVGDKALATQSALDYATNQISTRETSGKVRTWMTTNREFLNAVPEVKKSVSMYADTLERAERSNLLLDEAFKTAQTRAGLARAGGTTQSNQLAAQAEEISGTAITANKNALAAAAADAKKVVSDADLAATKISKESADAADKIWNRKNVSGRLNARKLIMDGDATQWALVAPIIKRSPDAKREVYEALRETLADRLSNKSAKGSTQWFDETVSPALLKFDMISPADAKALSAQLAVIEASRAPATPELGLWNRMFLQAVGGWSSSLGVRGAQAGFSMPVPDSPNRLAPKEPKSTNALRQ